MDTKSIRVRAAGIFAHEGRVLVHVVENKNDGKTWYIPPGGGIHYGETSLEALRREIREELGWEVEDECLIGSFESYHQINDLDEHEISFVYRAKPTDRKFLGKGPLEIEEDNGVVKALKWVSLDTLKSEGSLLYPDGLLGRLEIELRSWVD